MGMIVIYGREVRGRGLGGAIGEYLTLGRSMVSSIVGAKSYNPDFWREVILLRVDLGSLEQDWQSHLRQWSHSMSDVARVLQMELVKSLLVESFIIGVEVV